MTKIRGNTIGTTMSPDAVADKIGGGDFTSLNQHIANTENPHGVTIEQIGAAPAGYGLGEKLPRDRDWNIHYRSGFYKGKTNTPSNNNLSWYGVTCTESSVNQAQIAFCADTTSGLIEARRYKHGSTFGKWECVNPPMVEGMEYCTTERFNGKSVYTSLVDCGVFPSASVRKVEHCKKTTQIVRYTGSTPYYGCALPYWDGDAGKVIAQVYANKTHIVVECNVSTWSDYKCYVQIWYTKD